MGTGLTPERSWGQSVVSPPAMLAEEVPGSDRSISQKSLDEISAIVAAERTSDCTDYKSVTADETFYRTLAGESGSTLDT